MEIYETMLLSPKNIVNQKRDILQNKIKPLPTIHLIEDYYLKYTKAHKTRHQVNKTRIKKWALPTAHG